MFARTRWYHWLLLPVYAVGIAFQLVLVVKREWREILAALRGKD